jgi:DNA repair protein RadC
MTESLAIACEVVGIELLDHVVVARGGGTSLRELGCVRT